MKIIQPGAHLDQMLRQTRAHHVQLSAMADMKANMLLTMSAVIVTLSVPHVFTQDFQWPFLVLIVFCLITVCLAAYAVMPKLPLSRHKLTDAEMRSPKFNPLFFGDFIHLDYPQYESLMEEILNDHSLAYEAQVREVYVLGKFLARKKYRLLRLAYCSFITGLFTSVALMLIRALMVK